MEVTLIDSMGSDLTVVNAARVSFANFKNEFEPKDERLINYLAKHNHWTPFGHVQLQFRIKAPMFVARQLVKHQVGLVWNEVSRRYVDTKPEFYVINEWRTRPADGSIKQGSDSNNLVNYNIEPLYKQIQETYLDLLEKGVAPEIARTILPQSMYTEWIWTGSLAAFSRVCKLRCAKDTQLETQFIANKISELVEEKFPVSWKALIR